MSIRSRYAMRLALTGLVAIATLGFALPATAAEVTYERLINASEEPQNWLMRMGNYANWNNSSLSTINRDNVKNLKVKFMFAMGDRARPNRATQYFTPLVEDGFMYVGNQWQQYWKLDVREEKAKVVWKFDAKVEGGGQSPHSVALLGNNVYLNTGKDSPNPRLVALDKNSGEVVFDVPTTTPDVVPNQGHSAAPLAVKDKILIGSSNRGENGRGYVAAYDAKTGKFLWRFLVVPNQGQPGSESWADPRTIPTGGGGIWTEPSYDPATNLAYYGTANPVHMFDPQGRPGDNLYTNSIIALDVDSGQLKWHFQTVPNESWDYDAVAITQLLDVNVNGEMRKVISQTNRNGFYYARPGQRPVSDRQALHQHQLDHRSRSQDRQTARLRSLENRAGLRRPRRALWQEGGRRAARALRHADHDAEHLRPHARRDLLQCDDRAGELLQLETG